jgi:hypothetical protein
LRLLSCRKEGKSIPLLKRIRTNYLVLIIREFPTPPLDKHSPFALKFTIMSLPFGVRVATSEPKLSIDPSPNMSEYLPCSVGEWWRKPVLAVPGCVPLSRRDVVLGVADKEVLHTSAKSCMTSLVSSIVEHW